MAFALAMLAATAGAGARAAQVVDRVIAVVSGSVIMLSDARAALALGQFDAGDAADPVASAMRWLIDRRLVLDEAGRGERIDVDAAALDEAVAQVRLRFGSGDEYRRALEGLGLDESGVRRLVRDTMMARLYVEGRFDSALPATDEELRAFYERDKARFVLNGRQLSFEEALDDVTAGLRRERRRQAVTSWMDRLRRRADIREVYRSATRRM